MAAIHDEVRGAVDLITQPWLLEVLVGTETGRHPRECAGRDAEPELLRAAVARLTKIGAVESQPATVELDEPLKLTSRGADLLRLLRDLESETAV